MSKKKLSALKSKKLQAYVPEKDGMSGLDALMLNSMATGIAHIGAVQSAKTGKDWSYSEVSVIPGIRVSARIPPGRLVEMDGVSLVQEMVNAADRVLPALLSSIQAEVARPSMDPAAHNLLGIARGDSWSKASAIVAIVKELLEVQGWKLIPKVGRWRSPVWLYPPVMLKPDTLAAMVEEEVESRQGDALELDVAIDPLDVFDQ